MFHYLYSVFADPDRHFSFLFYDWAFLGAIDQLEILSFECNPQHLWASHGIDSRCIYWSSTWSSAETLLIWISTGPNIEPTAKPIFVLGSTSRSSSCASCSFPRSWCQGFLSALDLLIQPPYQAFFYDHYLVKGSLCHRRCSFEGRYFTMSTLFFWGSRLRLLGSDVSRFGREDHL